MSVMPFESLFEYNQIREEREPESLNDNRKSTKQWIFPEVVKSEGNPYKYSSVWKRMAFKARTEKTFEHLRGEIMLYGTTNNLRDIENNFKKNYKTVIDKKLDKMESFRLKTKQSFVDERKWYILYADRSFVKIWSFFLAFIMFYTVIFMPFRIAFMHPVFWDSWTVIDLMIDCFFFMDICINFLSPYHTPEMVLVTNLKAIAMNYMTSWFLLDILSCIPFALIDYMSGKDTSASNPRYNTILRLIRLPRLYKLLKLFRVFKILKHYKSSPFVERLQDFSRMNSRVFKLIKFVMSICLCVHISGCFWYFAARLDDFGPETWVYRHSLMDVPNSTAYIASIYWAFTTITTVGYGDIHPRTEVEIIFAMIWMIAGVGFYSIIVGSLTSLMTDNDSKESILNAKLAAVQDFCLETGIPDDSKRKMKEIIKYNCERGDFMWRERYAIFKELPKNLRIEVATSMYDGLARKVNFFADKEPAFVTEIMPYFRFMMFLDLDTVFTEGDYADEIYVIVKGRVNLVTQDVVYKSYLKGTYFGEIEIIQNIEYRVDTAQVCGSTELLGIHRKDFLEVITDFPATMQQFNEVSKERMLRNRNEKEDIQRVVFSNQKLEKPLINNFIPTDMDKEQFNRVIGDLMQRTQHELKNLSRKVERIEQRVNVTSR